MRRLRYQVAASLDGYIAGPNGEFDWITADPDVDFAALFKQFDTAIMGRKTFVRMLEHGSGGGLPGLHVVVFSRTLRAQDYPAASIVNTDAADRVRSLKTAPGKDLWLFGGGELFRTLLAAGLVDTVDVAVVPVLLGGGVPMLPPAAERTGLSLTHHRRYPKSGIMALEYAVTGSMK
jgi:dihydrofolate reductase